MTRKDYKLLALALASSRPGHKGPQMAQWVLDCKFIASHLASQSALFDQAKFLVACGMQEIANG